MPRGLITKALSGFYYVEEEITKKIYSCRGRGLFRNRKITPLVGDQVVFQVEAHDEGLLTEVLERKNELIRPPIANVDQVLLVFSVKSPDFNQTLLDRFLVVIEANGLKPLIILTKMDLIDNEDAILPYVEYYQSLGYPIIKTSKYDPQSIKNILPYLENKISVLAGQSGVGKSSLLNVMDPTFQLNTDEISKALGRGKHTTRHVELFPINNGLLADTPGFSSLDFQELNISIDLLAESFIDFFNLSQNCKYRGCLHISEPKCAVKEQLNKNKIYDKRYENYQSFYEELKNKKIIYKKKEDL
ncbi:MAG TPA: ribosome small subunit-dependent GTPase A [Haloplasmataceae bacterium]